MPARMPFEQFSTHPDHSGSANTRRYTLHPDATGEVLQAGTAYLACTVKATDCQRSARRAVIFLSDADDRPKLWNASSLHQLQPFPDAVLDRQKLYSSLPENLSDPMDADPAAVRFQDLFLAFPQSIDLGRLTVAAAFRAARKFDQISGSGFEIASGKQRFFRTFSGRSGLSRTNPGGDHQYPLTAPCSWSAGSSFQDKPIGIVAHVPAIRPAGFG